MSIRDGLSRGRAVYRRLFREEEEPEASPLPLPAGRETPLSQDPFGPDRGEAVFRLTGFEPGQSPPSPLEPSASPAVLPAGEAPSSSPSPGAEEAVEALIRRLEEDSRLGPQYLGEE